MRYDLALICDFCREEGLASRVVSEERVEIDLGRGAVLCFQNDPKEEDCLIGMVGMPWHTHDDLTFVGARGYYIEIDYLDLLAGLKDGRILICELEVDDRIVDRWLIHKEYNDEFRYLGPRERIIVYRAASHEKSRS